MTEIDRYCTTIPIVLHLLYSTYIQQSHFTITGGASSYQRVLRGWYHCPRYLRPAGQDPTRRRKETLPSHRKLARASRGQGQVGNNPPHQGRTPQASDISPSHDKQG